MLVRKKKNRRRKFLLVSVLFLVVAGCLSLLICNRTISSMARGKLYSSTTSVPFNKVGLLLGTSKYVNDRYINPYYQYRIDAAVELYKRGKIKYVIVSGDNSRRNYNEPELMKSDLVNAGVDSAHIYLDYAGFRTFDSVVRLKEIFGQHSVTIISQPFHNERAIYIASKEGIAAVGFNARDVSTNIGMKVQLREKLARVKVFIDFLLGKQPKYLGEKVHIP